MPTEKPTAETAPGTPPPGRTRVVRTAPLPTPWNELSYTQIMTRSGGRLVNDGRSSRVHLFTDGNENCYLKRYRYRKIHWRHCFERSQVERETRNLEKFRRAEIKHCRTIEILAWGERRRGPILRDAFLLSRAVAGGVRLSLFLAAAPAHPRRTAVIARLVAFGAEVIRRRLALVDPYFRNLVVVPETAMLYILDLQRCARRPGLAARKSLPQFWADIEIFLTPAERERAEAAFRPLLPAGAFSRMRSRAALLIPKELKRRAQEEALAAAGPAP